MHHELGDTPTLRASKLIRQQLQAISDAERARHPVLAHQDAIGLSLFLLSCATSVAVGLGYVYGVFPAWLTIVVAAFAMSILHELEHDLIHRLYFRNNAFVYNLMMFGVWLFRPSTLSPWVRRDWHLHHHRLSGTETDVEERMLTNGEPWGLRRALMVLDMVLSGVLRARTVHNMMKAYARLQHPTDRAARHRTLRRVRLGTMPFMLLYFGLWHTFLITHFLLTIEPALVSDFLTAHLTTLDTIAVVILIPNALRTFCLHFVSSNIHYYGDIESRNVVQQTQVWTSPWLLPLQAFCFNFGATHAIHHFVVQEPFYLRQLVARQAHDVLRAHGVRFNDFRSMWRGNRWHAREEQAVESGAAVMGT